MEIFVAWEPSYFTGTLLLLYLGKDENLKVKCVVALPTDPCRLQLSPSTVSLALLKGGGKISLIRCEAIAWKIKLATWRISRLWWLVNFNYYIFYVFMLAVKVKHSLQKWQTWSFIKWVLGGKWIGNQDNESKPGRCWSSEKTPHNGSHWDGGHNCNWEENTLGDLFKCQLHP